MPRLTLIACAVVLTALSSSTDATGRIGVRPPPAHAILQEPGSQEPPPPPEATLTAEDRETVELIRSVIAEKDLDAARELLHEVVTGFEAPVDGAEAARVVFLLDLDRFAVELGSLKDSLVLRGSLLELRTRILPPDHLDLLSAKEDLGLMRYMLDDLAGARELFQEVHEARARLLPPDHPDLLRVKQNLGVMKKELGDLAAARELCEEVHAARTRALPPNHPDLLAAKQNLAATRKDLGDLAGARELEEVVLEGRTRLLPPDHPDLLNAKQNLAATRYLLGDLAGAIELFEEVHVARTRLLPPDHPDLLTAKQNLGAARWMLGDLAGARELFEAVLVARARILPPAHPDLLTAKRNLGATMYALGGLEDARKLFEEVHAAWTGILRPDHPYMLMAMEDVASTRADLGDVTGAVEIVTTLLDGMLARASALRAEALRPAREGARAELQRLSHALFLSASVDTEHTLEDELFAILENLRLASISSAEAAHAIGSHPELAGQARGIAGVRSKLNDLAAAGPGDEGVDGWRAELLRLAEERDRAEGELQAKLAAVGAFVGWIDARALGARLADGTAAVSFLRYTRQFRREQEAGERPPSAESLLAFVVQSGGMVRRIELGPMAELEELVQDWRAALGRPIQGRGIGVAQAASVEERLDDAGRRLRERVLDPVLAAAGPVQTLHAELDDVLFLVPLDALPMGEGLVGERISIWSEATLARLLRADPALPEGDLVLAGGIAYDAEPGKTEPLRLDAATPPLEGVAARSAGGTGFVFLPGTTEESTAIARLYAEASVRKAILLTGTSATKAALFAAAPKTRFLHLATHGWFASERFKSQLDSSGERGTRDAWLRAEETLSGFAPETLCGLALAGANRGKDSLGRVPGILTAEELASFDLRNCELAVLSACETNVGIRRAGQGIQSLQTALHAAGARTAITSLWKVDDAATRRLFELFYTKLWKEKLGKSAALWQAKMALRAEGHPPRDWAGWVLSGDPD